MEEVAGAGSRLTMDGYGNNGVCSVSEILRDVGIGKSKEERRLLPWPLFFLSFVFMQTHCRERPKGEKYGGRDMVYAVCTVLVEEEDPGHCRQTVRRVPTKDFSALSCQVRESKFNPPVHTSPRIFLSRQVLFRYTPIKKSWFGG